MSVRDAADVYVVLPVHLILGNNDLEKSTDIQTESSYSDEERKIETRV